jgi:hypothetical protein
MALTKSQLIKNQILNPIKDLEVAELLPPNSPIQVLTPPADGKYVFLYDYETTIYTPEAKEIMNKSSVGKPFTLPANSFYNLRYSKGDVVDVTNVGLSKAITDGNIPYLNKFAFRLKVPPYVKPLEEQGVMTLNGVKFTPFFVIDNSLGWLGKIADTTPVTLKFGKNFGENLNPKVKPVIDNPVTPTTTDTPVVTNGVEDTTEAKSFFEDKNNLLMIAGVLLIGYLLLNDKSE